jgi:hypothetical protein
MLWFIPIAITAILFYSRRGVVVNENQGENDFWLKISKITIYDKILKEKADKYGLDWKMLKAIAMIETWLGTYKGVVDLSSERENAPDKADSSDGLSAGLFQVTLKTLADYDSAPSFKKLQDPLYSTEIAARHLQLLKKLSITYPSRQVEFMVKSYNQGQGNTAKEFSKKIQSGYANNYWIKYQQAYKVLVGG